MTLMDLIEGRLRLVVTAIFSLTSCFIQKGVLWAIGPYFYPSWWKRGLRVRLVYQVLLPSIRRKWWTLRGCLNLDLVLLESFFTEHCHWALIFLRDLWPVHLFDVLTVVLNLLVVLLFRLDMECFLFFNAQHLTRRPEILKRLLLTDLHALERRQLLSSLPLSLDLSPSFQLDLIFSLKPYSLIL